MHFPDMQYESAALARFEIFGRRVVSFDSIFTERLTSDSFVINSKIVALDELYNFAIDHKTPTHQSFDENQVDRYNSVSQYFEPFECETEAIELNYQNKSLIRDICSFPV